MFTDVYSRIQVSHYIIVTRNRQKPIQSQKNDNNFHIDTAKETGLLSFHTPEVCERKSSELYSINTEKLFKPWIYVGGRV